MAQENTDYLTPLLSLYAKYNQNNQLNNNYSQLQDQQQQQLASLNNLFTPNSAYAQTLREQLSRRDAARGARSQYGPREVELMAKLAGQQAQASQVGLQTLYSPQAMQMAQARASSNPNVSQPASLAMYSKMLGGLPSLYKAGNGLYNQGQQFLRTSDTVDKYNKFKAAINNGTAVDDTVNPDLWNGGASGAYAPDLSTLDYYNGVDYGTGLDVGDIYNYADYADTAADFSNAYDAYDTASTAADVYNAYDTASTASDAADWLSWMDY